MESITEFNILIDQWLGVAVGYVWGLPLVILLVGTGLLLTFSLKGVQIRGFFHAIKVVMGKYDDSDAPGEISHFQALCTALSATVGLGNIAGVAVAIHAGGPGATFWMILTGFVGMATKFSECSLAVMFRRIDDHGEVHGGPMHYIDIGLGPRFKPLAVFFALACIGSSFGAGNMFQSNQVAQILTSNFAIPQWVTGLTLALMTGVVIIGGIQRIGQVTSKVVPFMGGIYVLGALAIIVLNFEKVPGLLAQIIGDAFTGTAAAGGFAGVAVRQVIVQGFRRACFSNEAGLGSSPIAHSAAATKEPIREGSVALLEPFIDTIVICTMTALVILISGVWTQDINAVELTALAFNKSIPGFGDYFVPVAVFLFAYSTLLSWSYYGERAIDYLTNGKYLIFYKIFFCFCTFLGAIKSLGPVLSLSDILLGLMVIPNLIAVLLLFPKLKAETQRYFSQLKSGDLK